jgi:hypothetical protein
MQSGSHFRAEGVNWRGAIHPENLARSAFLTPFLPRNDRFADCRTGGLPAALLQVLFWILLFFAALAWR